jgi:transcriptional regulator with XRE-family HTH domain
VKPTYEVKAWQEDDWWLARVMTASDGADATPLNAITQARTLTRIEPMARDLVATILDADEGSFDIEVDYQLSHDVGELLGQAKGARAWLDAAQELWQERATVAARTLAAHGYSLREAATLLGLSHQRVDQLLAANVEHEPASVLAVKLQSWVNGKFLGRTTSADLGQVDAFLVIHCLAGHKQLSGPLEEEFASRLKNWLADCASHMSESGPAA